MCNRSWIYRNYTRYVLWPTFGSHQGHFWASFFSRFSSWFRSKSSLFGLFSSFSHWFSSFLSLKWSHIFGTLGTRIFMRSTNSGKPIADPDDPDQGLLMWYGSLFDPRWASEGGVARGSIFIAFSSIFITFWSILITFGLILITFRPSRSRYDHGISIRIWYDYDVDRADKHRYACEICVYMRQSIEIYAWREWPLTWRFQAIQGRWWVSLMGVPDLGWVSFYDVTICNRCAYRYSTWRVVSRMYAHMG